MTTIQRCGQIHDFSEVRRRFEEEIGKLHTMGTIQKGDHNRR
jgi:hypothetical protein